MPFDDIDTTAVARALAQIADQPDDLADVFFERSEQVELPPEDASPGLRVRRETGLAVRLVRAGRTWLAGRDQIDPEVFQDALRRAARALPQAPYPRPRLGVDQWSEPPAAPEILSLPTRVRRAIREQGHSLPMDLTVRRHRRWVLVVRPQLASETECETFYSIEARMPWGRYGRLLPTLQEDTATDLAQRLVRAAEGRRVDSPEAWSGPVILGADATAVLLHEAVSHALEADTLALGGRPEAAVGLELGSESLNVLDDPTSAPEGLRRRFDDEGLPTQRRWLLRGGRVEQPLCDALWAYRSDVLVAGAGRRGDRCRPPGPRSFHLELLSGELGQPGLMTDAEGGLYLPEVERGTLDPVSGRFQLRFPYGHRVHHRAPGEAVGPCRLEGHISDLLQAVVGIGRERQEAGAGWCAKGGSKLPVWATTPEIRLEGLEVRP